MTTLDDALAGATRHAKSAAIRDRGVTACPYPADGTPLQKAARGAWLGEYMHRRPLVNKVDYAGDLDAIAAGDDTGPGGLVDGRRLTDAPADADL